MTSETCTNHLRPNVLVLMAKEKGCAPIFMTNVFLVNMINFYICVKLDLSVIFSDFIFDATDIWLLEKISRHD